MSIRPSAPTRPAAEVFALRRKVIGPYRIEEVLGSGGMAVVCRARGPDGRAIAVKMLLTVLVEPSLVRRFAEEARLRVEHPNVVRVVDAGTDTDGTPFIAFELLEGETLEKRFERGPMRPAELVDLGVQVSRGLAAAHELGIVHRDLKPANLFCCNDGTIKVLDFGIALTQERTRLTSEGTVLGTANYLSPEQARGQLEFDARTDVWALGAVLYEGASGRAPFQRGSLLATMLAVLMEESPPLADVAPGLPPELARAIERALAKPVDARWSDISAFARALESADLACRPGESSPVSTSITAGENRVVALLLADGIGAIDRLEEAVRSEGGLAVRLLGGRVVGIFGGETSVGDESLRAARAALSARTAAEYIAVASGRATRSGASISGSALEAAERGCGARLGGVAVDSEAARTLSDGFALEPVAPGLFELASGPDGGRSGAPVHQPIVGRDPELAQLRAALRTMLDGPRAVAVLMTGPPGIGKTRLRRELEQLVRTEVPEVRVIGARAQMHLRDVPLSLMTSALRAAADLDRTPGAPRLDAATLEERQRAVVDFTSSAGLEAAATPTAHFLGELLGVPMPTTVELQAAREDPALMADRLRLALCDSFEALCRRRPVVLALEDAHFADGASLDLLDDLAVRLGSAPILLLVTTRPELLERRSDPFAGCPLVRIELRGLLPPDVETLAERVAARPVPQAVVRAIAERTAGNPLFVEAIVLELREAGQLDVPPEALPLPLSVEAAVQSRLDHLPFAEKEACKRGAVFGRPFSTAELGALDVPDAASVLASLVRRDLLSNRPRAHDAPAAAYAFRSALVSDVAYRMLADDIRAELHRRAAAYLERASNADPAEIAVHRERGGELARAAEAYAAAALAAAKRGVAETVLRCSERALGLGVPGATSFALRMARADAYRFMGTRDAWGAELAEAARVASTNEGQARLLTERAVWLWRTGRTEEASRTAEAAVASARFAEKPEALLLAHLWQGSILLSAGDLPRAEAALAEARRLSATAGPGPRALVAEWSGQLAAATGAVGEQLARLQQAVDLYREAGDLRRAAGAESNLADGFNRIGAYGQAERALRAALEACRRVGNRVMEGYALVNLGYSLSSQARTDEALEVLAEAGQMGRLVGDARLGLAARLYAGRAALEAREQEKGGRASAISRPGTPLPSALAGELEAVATEAEALELRGVAACALALAARGHLLGGSTEAALDSSEKAIALRDRLDGLEEDEAEVFLARALALSAAGQSVEADAVRERGRVRLEAIARGITDTEARKRFLSDVRANARLGATERTQETKGSP